MKFTDKKKREWLIDINLGSAEDIKKQLDIDLLSVDDTMKKIREDIQVLASVVWLCVEGQHNITPKEFSRSLSGQTIIDMQESFVEAYVDFCPSLPMKAILTKAVAETNKNQKKIMKAIQEVDFSEALKDGNSSISSPESLGSIPAPYH